MTATDGFKHVHCWTCNYSNIRNMFSCKLGYPDAQCNGLREKIEPDNINHPLHYNTHPSGIECIQITEHMNFNLGNAVKYIWRTGLKSPDALTDLHKAQWYIEREIARLSPKPDPK